MTDKSDNNKQTFGHRVNAWLSEPVGATFKHGKWRFWFPLLLILEMANAILSVGIFESAGGGWQSWLFPVVLALAGLLGWLCVGALHYSDSEDSRLARGVSLLDSITICFVIAHFCFLFWVQGRLITLHAAEAKYEAAATAYNAKADKVSTDNVEIARAAQAIAQETTKAEKLRNDTAYQNRRAAEAGARLPGARRLTDLSGPASPALATSTIELEKPTKPAESSTAFLTRWDSWIRVANFGELILAAVTLIFIRNRSAMTNTRSAPIVQHVAVEPENDFPDALDVESRTTTRRGDLAVTPSKNARRSSKVLGQDAVQEKTHDDLANGLAALREALSDISFYHPNKSFKAYLKPDAPKAPDHVLVRAMLARGGTQETTHSAKLKLSVLNAAVQLPHGEFRVRLTQSLNRAGFQLTEDRT